MISHSLEFVVSVLEAKSNPEANALTGTAESNNCADNRDDGPDFQRPTDTQDEAVQQGENTGDTAEAEGCSNTSIIGEATRCSKTGAASSSWKSRITDMTAVVVRMLQDGGEWVF